MKIRFIILIPLLALLVSCGEYQKVLKSNDLDYKFQKAEEYYNGGDYTKSLPLWEELRVLVVGNARAEKIAYYYAWTHYRIRDYYLAAYYFKTYARTYSTNEKAEECAYMGALCHFQNSPKYSLDSH